MQYMHSENIARQIISEVLEGVKDWRTLAVKLGIAKCEQDIFLPRLRDGKLCPNNCKDNCVER